MKIKSGFIVREVCGSTVVVAVGKRADEFNGMITLNESGKLLFERLTSEATENDLVEILLKNYDVEREKATECVKTFVKKLKDANVIDG